MSRRTPAPRGALAGSASSLVAAFAKKASPADILELGKLVLEARQVEQRAQVSMAKIAADTELALRTIALRERILGEVIRRRLDRTDRALDAFIDKLEQTDDPQQIAALASAIASVATSDSFSDLASVVRELKSDRVELKF